MEQKISTHSQLEQGVMHKHVRASEISVFHLVQAFLHVKALYQAMILINPLSFSFHSVYIEFISTGAYFFLWNSILILFKINLRKKFNHPKHKLHVAFCYALGLKFLTAGGLGLSFRCAWAFFNVTFL